MIQTIKDIRRWAGEGEGQVVAHRSRNADEGFYCIGQDIKVRVTSGHSRNRPEPVISARRASTGLLLLLLSHTVHDRASELAACFFFFSVHEKHARDVTK